MTDLVGPKMPDLKNLPSDFTPFHDCIRALHDLRMRCADIDIMRIDPERKAALDAAEQALIRITETQDEDASEDGAKYMQAAINEHDDDECTVVGPVAMNGEDGAWVMAWVYVSAHEAGCSEEIDIEDATAEELRDAIDSIPPGPLWTPTVSIGCHENGLWSWRDDQSTDGAGGFGCWRDAAVAVCEFYNIDTITRTP